MKFEFSDGSIAVIGDAQGCAQAVIAGRATGREIVAAIDTSWAIGKASGRPISALLLDMRHGMPCDYPYQNLPMPALLSFAPIAILLTEPLLETGRRRAMQNAMLGHLVGAFTCETLACQWLCARRQAMRPQVSALRQMK